MMNIDTVYTPEEYNNASLDMKELLMSKILDICNFSMERVETFFYSDTDDQSKAYSHQYPKSVQIVTVYRPFQFEQIPKIYQSYIPYIQAKFPRGDIKRFILDHRLYDRLYSWLTGKCVICFVGDLEWREGDKDIETCCSNCGDETFYVRHYISY